MKSGLPAQAGDATSVVSVFSPNPRPSDLVAVKDGEVKDNALNLDNNEVLGYNGFVYIVERNALMSEKKIITEKTKVYQCPAWRSVDIDTYEDWVLAEWLYKNKEAFASRLAQLKK